MSGKNIDEQQDCKKELCEVLEKLKEALCEERNKEWDCEYGEEQQKEGESQGNGTKEGESQENGQGEGLTDDQSRKDKKINNDKFGCRIKKSFEMLKHFFKHEKSTEKNTLEASNDMAFINQEIDKIRPAKPTKTDNHKCIVVFLVLCLFLPFVLLFIKLMCPNHNAIILNDNKLIVDPKMSIDSIYNKEKGEIIVVLGNNCSRNLSVTARMKEDSIVVFDTTIHKRDCSQNKQDDKWSFVLESKQRESYGREILLGISVIILMGAILCVIILYIKYLNKRQEREYNIDNSILEFNKRTYTELVKLKLSDLTIQKQNVEQDLELFKQADLLRFDEEQKCLEHKRKMDMRRMDLREKYMEKATEVINKYIETRIVDRKERKVTVETPNDADVRVEVKNNEGNSK